MAQIECGRGHLYDPDKYPACPYCNGNQKITVTAARHTTPIRAIDPFRTAPVPGRPVTGEHRTAPLPRQPGTGNNRTAPSIRPVKPTTNTSPITGVYVTAQQTTPPPL